ncbi:MAG: hypothetical protein FWG83_01770 [Oscillospiraceae bacterium]|nr:hypothetical protein [Oscillospiraceae bacterium]
MKTNHKTVMRTLIAIMTTLAMIAGMAACKNKSTDVEDNLNSGENVSYEKAERALLKNGLSGYSTFSGMLDSSAGGSGELTFTFTPEQYINDLLASSGMSPVDSLNPTTLKLGAVIESDSKSYLNLAYLNGSKEVLSLDYWLDGNDLIMSLPALLDKYLTIKADDIYGDMGMMSMMDFALASPAQTIDFPSDEALQSLSDAVFDKYFELVSKARVREDVEIEMNGAKFTTDRTTINLNEKNLSELALVFLKAVRSNKEIKDFIIEVYNTSMPFSEFDVELLNEILDEAIEDGEEFLANLDREPETIATMVVYISGSHIIRREFSNVYGEVKIIVSGYETKDEYFSEFLIEDNDGKNGYMRFSNSGEKDGDSSTGVLIIDFNDMDENEKWREHFTFTADYKNVTATSGDISISFKGSDLPESVGIELSYRTDSFTGSLTLGGVKVGTAELIWKDNFSGKAKPTINSGNSIDLLNDDSSDLSEDLLANLIKITESFENDGYDILGLSVFQTISTYLEFMNGGYYNSCPLCGEDSDICYYDCYEYDYDCPDCGQEDCYYDCGPCFFCDSIDCVDYECFEY